MGGGGGAVQAGHRGWGCCTMFPSVPVRALCASSMPALHTQMQGPKGGRRMEGGEQGVDMQVFCKPELGAVQSGRVGEDADALVGPEGGEEMEDVRPRGGLAGEVCAGVRQPRRPEEGPRCRAGTEVRSCMGGERRGAHREGGCIEEGGRGGLDKDLGANLKAQTPPGVTQDGAPDASAHRPAMPWDALPGPSTDPPVAPSAFLGWAAEPGCALGPVRALRMRGRPPAARCISPPANLRPVTNPEATGVRHRQRSNDSCRRRSRRAAAFRRLLSRCSPAYGLRLSTGNTRPVTNTRAMGAPHQQSSCSYSEEQGGGVHTGRGGGGWHKASVFGCLPLAAPICLSTLCGGGGGG